MRGLIQTLREWRMVGVALLWALSAGCATTATAGGGQDGTVGSASDALATANSLRQGAGAPALAWSDQLADSAQRVAKQAAGGGCVQPSGKPAYRTLSKVTSRVMSGADVVARWAAKPNLRAVVVQADYTNMGCGVASCGDKRQVWVCHYQALEMDKGVSKNSPVDVPDEGPALGALPAHNAARGAAGANVLAWSDELTTVAEQLVKDSTAGTCDAKVTNEYAMLAKKVQPPIRAKELVKRWVKSDAIRARVTKKEFTRLGCAMGYCADNHQIWICLYK